MILPRKTAAFAINLVQDVNILRPLMIMAKRDFDFEVLLLISPKFSARDLFGIWRSELHELAEQTGARLKYYEDDWDAYRALSETGILFAGSESHLPNHSTTHDLIRNAPPGFLRVTLQHGFECVGFHHSADHVRAHGETASFAADIVCAWAPEDSLSAIAASQRSKLHVTGSTALLQMSAGQIGRPAGAPGIVCENLHSVRFKGAGDFKGEFVDAFAEYCGLLQQAGREVVLRPHPGGQYVLKNKVALPANARVDNSPMYRLDLRKFSYGISAPSSVLVDMLLANIPTAVWRDRGRGMDSDNYAGLTSVSTPREWFEFARQAEADPLPFLETQDTFLKSTGMPLTPREVFSRFAELFQAARRMESRPIGAVSERSRLLFVANGNVPTLQLSFDKPLAGLVNRGEIATRLLTEPQIRAQAESTTDSVSTGDKMEAFLDSFDPSTIIFCRYSGPGYKPIIEWARARKVPVLYHIDDDLLAIPPDIGERKFALHNAPARIDAVRYLLTKADLVYASTERLKKRLLDYFPDLDVVAGRIYCSGKVIRHPEVRETCTVGYMASADHAHNLTMILPAIERLLERNPHTRFHLFGSIPIPDSLVRFGDRVQTSPPIANYETFLEDFAAQRWDVGICPLVPIDFNLMKANTKWVEYSSAGVAVVASRGTVYDECCAGGCGLLAESEDEWLEALERLANDPELRVAQVDRAQDKIRNEYSIAKLRAQVLEIISQVKDRTTARMTQNRELEVQTFG